MFTKPGDTLWSAVLYFLLQQTAFLYGAVRVRVRRSEGGRDRSGFWNEVLGVVNSAAQ
jgi:hypothetical protein